MHYRIPAVEQSPGRTPGEGGDDGARRALVNWYDKHTGWYRSRPGGRVATDGVFSFSGLARRARRDRAA